MVDFFFLILIRELGMADLFMVDFFSKDKGQILNLQPVRRYDKILIIYSILYGRFFFLILIWELSMVDFFSKDKGQIFNL
jgi:hypothetical protein